MPEGMVRHSKGCSGAGHVVSLPVPCDRREPMANLSQVSVIRPSLISSIFNAKPASKQSRRTGSEKAKPLSKRPARQGEAALCADGLMACNNEGFSDYQVR
jgi:hypothetical protein